MSDIFSSMFWSDLALSDSPNTRKCVHVCVRVVCAVCVNTRGIGQRKKGVGGSGLIGLDGDQRSFGQNTALTVSYLFQPTLPCLEKS